MWRSPHTPLSRPEPLCLRASLTDNSCAVRQRTSTSNLRLCRSSAVCLVRISPFSLAACYSSPGCLPLGSSSSPVAETPAIPTNPSSRTLPATSRSSKPSPHHPLRPRPRAPRFRARWDRSHRSRHHWHLSYAHRNLPHPLPPPRLAAGVPPQRRPDLSRALARRLPRPRWTFLHRLSASGKANGISTLTTRTKDTCKAPS